MCIAIYSPKGNEVPCDKYLKESWDSNPDGAGFAFNLDKGKVKILKGFMNYDSFKKSFDAHNKKYDFKNRGVLIHFRIQTHGGVCPECTHPFPLIDDEGALKKSEIISDYAVIHNGIISLTGDEAKKREKMSDTMVFIEKYLTKIASNKNWFSNPKNWELIYDLAGSKVAVLDGNGSIGATYGFTKDEDGNYYSNSTYKESRYLYKYFGCYNHSWNDWDYEYSDYKYDKAKVEYISLMELKDGEIVLTEDGLCYSNKDFKGKNIFVSVYGDVFIGNKTGKSKIIRDKLEWFGFCAAGEYFEEYGVYEENTYKSVDFRKDCWVKENDISWHGLESEDLCSKYNEGYEDDNDEEIDVNEYLKRMEEKSNV